MADEVHLDDNEFWDKVKRTFSVAGREVIKLVLMLFYCLRDDDTPVWAKATIIGALLYFISPLDAIPDFVPGAGYADDLAVLGAAAAVVVACIKSEHRERAQEWVDDTFGPLIPGADAPEA